VQLVVIVGFAFGMHMFMSLHVTFVKHVHTLLLQLFQLGLKIISQYHEL